MQHYQHHHQQQQFYHPPPPPPPPSSSSAPPNPTMDYSYPYFEFHHPQQQQQQVHHHQQQQQLCIPPDLLYPPPPASSMNSPTPTPTPTPPSTASSSQSFALQQQESYVPTQHNPLKRSPSPIDDEEGLLNSPPLVPTSPTKKSRNERGERISSKDFVPPDVTGLSKREARLVKNRAAAFLSRQRKREEFEALEIRVQELELENAQLRGGNPPTSPPSATSTSSVSSHSSDEEVTRLRAELTTSTRRCTLLEQDLQRIRSQQQQQVKSEPTEDELSSVGSESPLIAPSSCGSAVEESSSQGSRSSGLMMALLLLLAPVLTPSSSSQQQSQHSQQQHEQTTFFHENAFETNFHLPNRFDSFGIFDTPSTTTSLSFDHLLPPTPSTTTSPSSFHSSPSSLTFPATPCTPSSGAKREVELDVHLTRDAVNPDRVKVKLLSPSSSPLSSSSLTFPPTPPSTASDFLPLPLDFGGLHIGAPGGLGLSGLPTTYSYTSSGEKKRVRIAVSGEDSGEWEVQVKN